NFLARKAFPECFCHSPYRNARASTRRQRSTLNAQRSTLNQSTIGNLPADASSNVSALRSREIALPSGVRSVSNAQSKVPRGRSVVTKGFLLIRKRSSYLTNVIDLCELQTPR